MSSHAELCPNCNGKGEYYDYTYFRYDISTAAIKRICHVCNGKGYIILKDEEKYYGKNS